MAPTNNNRVRLERLDWLGIGTLALTIVSLLGATLLEVHELARTNRERLAAVDAELASLHGNVALLQDDVRELARRQRP
ncbi:hypothetical protein [Botrimarina sp.]|uniref:hypothetical protein n=1 Tax=Botrimarina sp. TaxID=2795802 RepID=UPI0032EB7028